MNRFTACIARFAAQTRPLQLWVDHFLNEKTSRSKEAGTLDEERRLFYVAITRAMKTLDVSHCTGRKRYGQLMPCQATPFLKGCRKTSSSTLRCATMNR